MSPEANAAWEAYCQVMERVGVLEDHGDALAAFLDVVADQVVPDEGKRYPIHLSSASWMRWDERKRARAKLLSLAAELRGPCTSPTTTTEAQS